MSNFKDAEKWQYKKVIPPTGDQRGKDTQAPQPRAGKFVGVSEHIKSNFTTKNEGR